MPDITPRGYKKPFGTEGYAIDIVNFNTQKNEDEHDTFLTKTGDGSDVTVDFLVPEVDEEIVTGSLLSKIIGLIKKKFGLVSQQLEDKADKESPQFTGTPTINGNEIATVNNIPSGLSLGETSSTAYRGDRGKIAYDHSQSAHAPSSAQKNSDITKAEIEAKLIGDISTHYHASDSTKAPTMHAVADGTYGLGTYSAYGHVKTYQGLDFLGADAYALHANQGKVLKDLIDTKTKVVTGTYTGDDMAARFINLGFTPKAVFVFPRRWQNIYNIYGLAVSGSPSITSSITQNNISVETNGFNIYAGPGDIYTQTAASTNRTGYEYNYVAIG